MLKANTPNILTWIRIAAIPLVVGCFFSDIRFEGDNLRDRSPASCSAWRPSPTCSTATSRGNSSQMSKFGEFLDPVADKLMVATCLVLLVQTDPGIRRTDRRHHHRSRDYRFGVARVDGGLGATIRRSKVGMAGKIKTTFQMFGIAFMVYRAPVVRYRRLRDRLLPVAGRGRDDLWSMFVYLRAAWPSMADHRLEDT